MPRMKYLYAHNSPEGLFYIGVGNLSHEGPVSQQTATPHLDEGPW